LFPKGISLTSSRKEVYSQRKTSLFLFDFNLSRQKRRTTSTTTKKEKKAK
jgi:hypothetical protein